MNATCRAYLLLYTLSASKSPSFHPDCWNGSLTGPTSRSIVCTQQPGWPLKNLLPLTLQPSTGFLRTWNSLPTSGPANEVSWDLARPRRLSLYTRPLSPGLPPHEPSPWSFIVASRITPQCLCMFLSYNYHIYRGVSEHVYCHSKNYLLDLQGYLYFHHISYHYLIL